MDSGNYLPPTHIPKNIMQNYAMNSHRTESLDTIEDVESRESKPYLLKHGGKWLAALIAISAVIFIILFYDSMCIESKTAAVVPDKLDLIMGKLNIKMPEIPTVQ